MPQMCSASSAHNAKCLLQQFKAVHDDISSLQTDKKVHTAAI